MIRIPKSAAILLSVISVVVLLFVAVVFIPGRNVRWEAMRSRIGELKTEAQSRSEPRSVLRGKPIPGNAWTEYRIAVDDASMWPQNFNSVMAKFINRDGGADRAAVEKFLAEHADALEHLHLGAQRSDGQYPYEWNRGRLMALPSLNGTRRLAQLAAAQARILAESGRPQEAVSLLLDVSVFGRDLATNAPLLSQLVGLSVDSIAFDEMRQLLLAGKLKQSELAALAKDLETVDRDFPTFASGIENETLAFGASILEFGDATPLTGPWWGLAKEGGWRYGFSAKAVAADAFEVRDAQMQRAQKIDAMQFTSANKEARAIEAEVEASENPVLRMSTPSLTKIYLAHRDVLVHLRLLRAGVAALAQGEVQQIPDPFGENLLHDRDAHTLRIWSIGRDGKNQNGQGSWAPSQPDIVLEIPTK